MTNCQERSRGTIHVWKQRKTKRSHSGPAHRSFKPSIAQGTPMLFQNRCLPWCRACHGAVDSKFCTQDVAEVPGAPPSPGIVSVTVRSPVGSLKVMAMARHGQISSPTELLAICHQALSQKTHVKPRPAQYSKSI